MMTKTSILRKIFCSCLCSGTVLQLTNFNQLPLLLQVSFGEWLNAIIAGLHLAQDANLRQSSLQLLSEHSQDSAPSDSLCSLSGMLDAIPEENSAVIFKVPKPQRASSSISKNNSRLDWYNMKTNVLSIDVEEPQEYVKIDGSLINISPLFACILIGDKHAQQLPQQLKVSCLLLLIVFSALIILSNNGS